MRAEEENLQDFFQMVVANNLKCDLLKSNMHLQSVDGLTPGDNPPPRPILPYSEFEESSNQNSGTIPTQNPND
jgi:hypothetical protein